MNARHAEHEGPVSALAAPPNGQKRRFLPRFGLRSLLIVGLVFSLGFGWIGKNLYRMRQEDAAIETLKRAGATVMVMTDHGRQQHPATPHRSGYSADESEFASLAARALGFADPAPINDVILSADDPDDPLQHDALAALANLPRIQSLEFVGPAFDDTSLDRLPALPHAIGVMFTRTAVTSEGVAKLKKLPSLRILAAGDLDARYDLVAGLSALDELREIDLYVQDLSREDVAALASLPRLELVELAHVTLQGSDVLEPLSDAASIEEFHLSVGPASRPLTDADMQAICKMPNLRVLTLGDGHELLKPEVEVDSLRLLRLYGPTVDLTAARAFSAKHPDCLVAISAWCGVVYFLAGEEADYNAAVEMEKTIAPP